MHMAGLDMCIHVPNPKRTRGRTAKQQKPANVNSKGSTNSKKEPKKNLKLRTIQEKREKVTRQCKPKKIEARSSSTSSNTEIDPLSLSTVEKIENITESVNLDSAADAASASKLHASLLR